ncbi:MAG TPA: TIM-barrel domain-containing protein [Acidimicrobiales bacterium]|nr:TIM-barrel domain-containing protein [Acidimicrobiales bacterium]
MGAPPSRLRAAGHRVLVTAHAVRHLGMHTTGLIVANSARRRLHATRGAGTGEGPPVTPGALQRVEAWNPRPGVAQFHFERARLEVAFLAADVVRVTWGPGPLPVPYALAGEPDWPVPEVQAHPLDALRPGGPWVLRSEALEVAVGPDGTLRTARPGGPVRRSESPPARRGVAWEQTMVLRPGERLCGLGEQAAGVDLRGGVVRLWNTDPGGSWGPGQSPMYVGMPVLVAAHPEGDVLVFYENSTDATFRLGQPDDDHDADGVASVRFAGGVLRRYLVAGPLPVLLDRYTELTGRPALAPRWALGYHQSRWGYRTEGDVAAVAAGFAELGIPLSAVHVDIDYMDGFRVFTVDRTRFPALDRLTGDLARTGTRLVTILDTAVKVDPGFALYRDGLERHLFCTDGRGRVVEGVVWPGRCAYPDFTDPAARSWWAAQYPALVDAGVAGFWHDMNEPTSIALLGDPTLPTATRHDFDGRGGDHGEAHNLYGMLMNRAGAEGVAAARPGHRPFVVSRSGWAGNQRWAWNWTGDAASTWAAMRQQIATVVGLGLSGLPFTGSDTGGFSGDPGDELYLRWLQMSVCMPYCRTHSVLGVPRREPWFLAEPTRSLVAGWIRFRYRLLPYLYTLAHHAAATGAPLVRPVWWPQPGTAPVRFPEAGEDDAFLLGEALLVLPVTLPGARHRARPLLPGRWPSLWAPGDGDGDEAGVDRVAAPLERMPVLVRAGSVLPLDDGWADPAGPCRLEGDEGPAQPAGRGRTVALDHAPVLLGFHCFPDAEGAATGTCADDAGDGDGPVRADVVEVEGARAGEVARCRWARSGDYPAPAQVRVVLHGLEADRARADGVEVPVTGGVVTCGAFEELVVEGLRPGPGGAR